MDATSLSISLGLDAAPVKLGLKDLLAQFGGIRDEMPAALANIKGFDSLQSEIAATGESLRAAQADMDALAAAMQEAGSGASAALAADFKVAEERAASLTQTLAAQSGQVDGYRQALQAAGVDAGNLAKAEEEVKASYAASQAEMLAMAQTMQSRDLLGVKSHKDIQAEIERTKAAYKALTQSGQLSAKEQAQAWVATQERIRDLKNETNGWWERAKEAKLAIIGASGAALGLYKVMKSAIGGAIEYERAFAEVKMTVKGTASWCTVR